MLKRTSDRSSMTKALGIKHLWTLMLEIVNGYIYVKQIPFIQIHIARQHQYMYM
jgi:hypothetical protein